MWQVSSSVGQQYLYVITSDDGTVVNRRDPYGRLVTTASFCGVTQSSTTRMHFPGRRLRSKCHEWRSWRFSKCTFVDPTSAAPGAFQTGSRHHKGKANNEDILFSAFLTSIGAERRRERRARG